MNKGLLLDSHVLLWAAAKPDELRPQTRRLLESEASRLYISAASIWELLLKAGKRKLDLGPRPAEELATYCHALRALVLPIEAQHAYMASTFTGTHKDPFDRMLAAQARFENLTLVTKDPSMRDYGIQTIW